MCLGVHTYSQYLNTWKVATLKSRLQFRRLPQLFGMFVRIDTDSDLAPFQLHCIVWFYSLAIQVEIIP